MRKKHIGECGHPVSRPKYKRCWACHIAPVRYCKRGHDRTVVGVYGGSTCKRCTNERTAQYQKEHRKAYRQYMKNYVWRQKTAMIEAYGGSCVCCGEEGFEFLTIDHINGGGTAKRRAGLEGGGSTLYAQLRKQGYPKDNFRLLCFNCNGALGAYQYCPHQTGGEVMKSVTA